jgi:ubiquinone/menaquinone biosynthesis C-methylase UbiE
MADATTANLRAFDRAWTSRVRFAGRFRYNLEAARKEFVAMLAAVGIPRSGQRVLDVGFGSGMLMFEFDHTSAIRGVEISTSALATARELARRRGYLDFEFVPPVETHRLPYPDRSFSVVIASHVVEHVEDDIGFLRELLRVLSPDGWLIVIGPLDSPATGLLDEEALFNPEFRHGHFHVRNYNRQTFEARVERAGGRVERSVVSMATWDWKVRGDVWRSRLNQHLVGKVVDRGIAVALNLPLSLAPRAGLRALDRFFERRGYQPRQVALAVRREQLNPTTPMAGDSVPTESVSPRG